VIGVIINDLVFISVRGTSALYNSTFLYDCGINIKAGRASLNDRVKFHRGFAGIAIEVSGRLEYELNNIINNAKDVQIYITGHSLGGAVAAIILNLLCRSYSYPNFLCRRCGIFAGPFEFHRIWHINSAYTFGMPRYGNLEAIIKGRSPYHIFHGKDVVPRLPPKIFGYSNCSFNIETEIRTFSSNSDANHGILAHVMPFISTLCQRIFYYHSIEGYIGSTKLHINASDRIHAIR
jgi:putative lipase involved disintegration of autophagic bodies